MAAAAILLLTTLAYAQVALVTMDTSAAGQRQVVDGFGTYLGGSEALQTWWQNLYYGDLQASMLHMPLTPVFKSPYSDNGYNSPNYAVPGPDGNYVRTYTNATTYTNLFMGTQAKIAVMGPNIDSNIAYFDFTASGSDPQVAGQAAQTGKARLNGLGDFKLFGSLLSPAPWLKLVDGHLYGGPLGANYPVANTPFPFIWLGNFAGGVLDTSGTARPEFDDSSLGGTGPTSALTQFARCTAAYLRGFQNTYGVPLYAISIQNELDFDEFYNSCYYPSAAGYVAAIEAVRAELDQYPDLAGIKIMGPEDVLGGDYAMWQYGGGSTASAKNLQFLQAVGANPLAAAAEAFFCIHDYDADSVEAGDPTPATHWNWWVNGWGDSLAPGIPANVHGFTYYGKKSWQTEHSGDDPAWLNPSSGFPGNGAWSLALRIQQALTVGQESAWAYLDMTDGNPVSVGTLTDSTMLQNSPKYVAAKHFFRYIRPNSICVNATVTGSTALTASAFLHATNGTMTVVLINSTNSPIQAVVTSPAQPAGIPSWQTFTSSDANYWQISTTPIANGSANVSIPGYGVVTLYGVVASGLSLTWNNPLAITYGTALSSNQLNATANVPGSFAYNPTNGTVLNAGTNTLSVIFTPTDTVDYSSATGTVSLIVLPAPPFVSAVMAANPVGYWRLNETNNPSSGTVVAVDAMNNFNGNYGRASADGVPGPKASLGFSGFENSNTAACFTNGIANSFLTLPALNLNTNTVAISAWIYPIGTPAANCGLVFCRPGGDASGLDFTTGGQLGYTWNQNNSDTWNWHSGLVPPLQQWSFVALVISPARAIIYLCNAKGVHSATNAIAHTAEAFNASTLIGGDSFDGNNGSRTFNGIMDEVAVFNSALTPVQVLDLYSNAAALVTWTKPGPITYGAALTTNQLNATANVAGSFAYTPTNGTVLNAGTHTLSVIFTPTDTVDYSSATDTVSLVVSPASLTVTANNQTKTYGQTVTFAGTEFATGGLVNGDTVTSVTLTSSGAAATATVGGSPYNIVPSAAEGTGLANYTLAYANGALTVSPASLTVTASNRTKTYGQSVTFAGTEFTTSGLLNSDRVNSVTLNSSGAAAAATVGAAPYTIVPSASVGTGLNNYTIAYANGTLTVNPAALTITANNQTKTYGQTVTFAGTEFTTGGLVNGDTVTSVTLTSSGAAATATVGGSPYTIVPSAAVGTGLTNYTVNLVNGTLIVGQATPVITWTNASPIIYGAALTTNQLNATANVAGSFAYNPTNGTVLNAGTNTLSVIFVPTDTVEYSSATDTVSLVVSPASLTVTANDQTKTYGQTVTFAGTEFTTGGLVNGDTVTSVTLTSSGAAGTATVGGPPYTIVPSASVSTGLNNYTIAYANGTLTVNPAALTITANNETKTYGQTVTFAGTEFTTGGLVNGDTVTGVTLTSSGAAATATVAGSPYTIVPSAAVGIGLTNYTVNLVNGTLVVGQATPVISWTNASPIIYGVALTTNQLNATADVAGSFAYNPTNGTVLNAGTNTLSVIFFPTDTVEYSGAIETVSLVVSPASLTVTANNQTKTYGQTLTFAGTEFTTGGLVNGDTVTSVTLTSSGAAGTATVGDSPYTIVPSAAVGTGLTNYTVNLVNGTLIVIQATPVITWTSARPIIYGAVLTTNQLNATADVAGSFAYNPTNGTVLNAGTNTLSVIFVPTDTVDYSSATDTVSLNVERAGQTITFAPVTNALAGVSFPLTATASSGLSVSFALLSGPASLSGNVITATNAGTVVIQASQAGNTNYSAAPVVTQSVSVSTGPVPFLQITLLSNRISVSWPASAYWFILQTRNDLTSNLPWTAVTNGLETNGAVISTTINVDSLAAFYRLAFPAAP